MIKGRFFIAVIFSGLFLLATGTPVNAQQYQEYDESDYDGTYDYDDLSGSNYDDAYSTYFRSTEGSKRYRGHAREEELYNGGYRKYIKEDLSKKQDNWGISGIGFRKKNPGSADQTAPDVSNPGKPGVNNWYQGTDGINKNRNPEMFNADGTVSGNDNDEPGKGTAGGGDNNEFGPPPPPDEPDVPVDTAIPLLIAGGILIASFRFYITKNGSY